MNRISKKRLFGLSMSFLVFLAYFFLTATTTLNAGSSGVLGTWNTDGGDSRLELFNCGDKICGKIVWLKVPKYIDRNDGPVGKTKVDWKNPNPALKKRPILGLQIVQGLTTTSENRWASGTCYNPESGKTYNCAMRQTSPDRLELRGYIGISLFGRNFGLTRYYSNAK